MPAPARGFNREQRTPIVYGILGFVVVLLVRAVIWPAALVSTACLGLAAGLLRYLRRLEQAASRPPSR